MDLVCYDDMDPNANLCSSPLQELEQDLYHRLIEDYGTNADDPDRGVGLYMRLSGPVDAKEIARAIELDFEKDARVKSTKVLITQTAPGVYQLDIAVEADAGALGITLSNASGGVQRISSSMEERGA